MEFHLDRTLRLNVDPEYASLYAWAICEIDCDGRQVGGDWVAWPWGLDFGGTTPYEDYVHASVLHSLQHPVTREPLEMSFLVVTQVMELYFGLIGFELRHARDRLADDDVPGAVAALRRCATQIAALRGAWLPIRRMTPREFNAFRDGLALAERLGLRPRWRHIANSAAILTRPDAHFDLVRAGIAMYGLSPVPGTAFGLRPAMTVRARVVIAKRAPAGQGVSYGHTYTTSGPTTLAVVPLGYADGVPRAASNVASVRLARRNRTIAGRVCMDQFVVDCGDDEVHAGDVAVLFGPGDAGEPTVDDWAAATGTINYEIVTRMSTARVPRTYAGATPDAAGGTAAPEGEARR